MSMEQAMANDPAANDPAASGGGLAFPDSEVTEARRFNRVLMWSPRFRAPNPPGRSMIQAMMRASQSFIPHGVAGVRVRTLTAETSAGPVGLRVLSHGDARRGVYLDYHGGGWCIGNAAMDDPLNARIARDCGLVAVSVDYTLMPRATLQQVIGQARAAADWVADNAATEFGASDIVAGGESAGAHLAAHAVLHLRKRPDFARVKGAVLFYGAFDLGGTERARNAPAHSLVLHGPSLRKGGEALLPGLTPEQRQSPDLSPAYADLSGLPPALMLCGTEDPLLDDTKLLAERWRAANGNVTVEIVPEAPHAFNRFRTRMADRTNAHVRHWISEQMAVVPAGMQSAAE